MIFVEYVFIWKMCVICCLLQRFQAPKNQHAFINITIQFFRSYNMDRTEYTSQHFVKPTLHSAQVFQVVQSTSKNLKLFLCRSKLFLQSLQEQFLTLTQWHWPQSQTGPVACKINSVQKRCLSFFGKCLLKTLGHAIGLFVFILTGTKIL